MTNESGAVDGGDAEGRAPRPRSLIISLYGSYARELGGWISVGDLIRLMAELDVDAPAVRSSVSRLKRRGMLAAKRVDGVAGYALTAEAERILEAGDRRIFGRQVARLADGWILVVFSIPEVQRHKRHLLRSRLAWLGFGTTTAGVWVAPAHLETEARATLERLDVSEYVDLFHARHLGFGALTDAVAQWWDLAGLSTMYDDFLLTHEPVLARWRARRVGPENRAGAFADYLRAIDAWRRMPYLDPGLPPELVPADWSAARAAAVFSDLHERLRDPGLRHVRDVVGGGQGS